MKKNEVFQIGETEHLSEFPVRQDIPVSPADDPKRLKGRVSYLGNIIYRVSKKATSLTEEEIFDRNKLPKFKNGNYRYHKTIKKEDSLKVGDKVLVYKWDYKYEFATIRNIYSDHYPFCASVRENDETHVYHTLLFGKDDRNCWIADGICIINTGAIKRLEVTMV